MRKHLLSYTAALIGFVGLSSSAHAQEEYMKRGATVEDYEHALNRVMDRHRGIVTERQRQSTRSQARHTTNNTHAKAPAPAQSSSRASQPPDIYTPSANDTPVSDGVSIYFGFDSADLTRSARAQLENLGGALAKPEFETVSWLVEGHTDSSGSAEYNQTLSEKRAQSARRFLIERCGIPGDKLTAVGKGEREPYDSRHPDASVNRRVRLRPSGD